MNAPAVETASLPPLPLPREAECPFGPVPEYAALREHAPVTKVQCPTGITAWLVTRYADVREVLGDPERFHSRPGASAHLVAHTNAEVPLREGEFPRMNGAEHLRFRRQMAPELSNAKRMEQFRPLIQRMVDEGIDALAATTPPVDLHTAFSRPLTTGVIAELIGVPPDDRALFENAGEALFHNQTSTGALDEALMPLFQYLYTLVVARRANPGEDVLSRMIVRSDATDEPFTDLELLTMAAAMLIAGYDTTAGMISYSMLALLEHPDQLNRLREDPGIAQKAAEELVRFLGVGTGLARQAAVDTTIAGQPIAAGDHVVVAVQSANRDPVLRESIDELDLALPPVGHLGFGHGPHHCVGQQLARLEITTVLRTLPQRIPSLRLAVPLPEVQFRTDELVRGPAVLPVTWDEILPARSTVDS
jgi:cytochrome P450